MGNAHLISNASCVFGAHEWAHESLNIIDGCKHNCKYCYSKEMAVRFKRCQIEDWEQEKIRQTAYRRPVKQLHGTYMFPSTHDIHPDNLSVCMSYLSRILPACDKVLVVSKPHFECIEAICKAFHDKRDKILFRFTIGSSNNDTLKFWEPGAPSFEERFKSLEYAHSKRFNTSVSCEPLLDNNTDELIYHLFPHITDSIWLGKPNFLMRRLRTNGVLDEETERRANELLTSLNDEFIHELYNKWKDNPKIKWKESIKKIIGLKLAQEKGLDE